MELKTRVFDLYPKHYPSLAKLAKAMAINPSSLYRVLEGKRDIGQKFIVGAMKALPGYNLEDLFYIAPDGQAPQPRQQLFPADSMLTIGQVARLLNVHINTVRRWSKKGSLKSYRLGTRGDMRFWREDVERFLKGADNAV